VLFIFIANESVGALPFSTWCHFWSSLGVMKQLV